MPWCQAQIACDADRELPKTYNYPDCAACRRLAEKRINAAKKPPLRGMNVKFTVAEGRWKEPRGHRNRKVQP
jgi:hypothetical protein